MVAPKLFCWKPHGPPHLLEQCSSCTATPHPGNSRGGVGAILGVSQNWSLKGFQETGVHVATSSCWMFPYERRMILIDIDLHMLVTKKNMLAKKEHSTMINEICSIAIYS